jgi:flagellar hook assembly protein FlgD
VRRILVLVLALVLVASLGVAVSPVAAANAPSNEPKVVIIVGATHGATAGYRADADRAYAEAIRYTADVTKVYSPNATWSRVKAATVGASIVIYMGHGNGWPSPYTYDPEYTTKDGFGLNATAGNGDYNNKYYGEPSVSTLDLAPGAIVLLHHLCYASGNSEPGDAEPTVTVARKRADNYAAGFLKAGAAAVIADGHAGAESYLRALFTTHQSLEAMWRTMPNQNGHVSSFPSSRTPGATIFQDPNKASSGYYRSLAVGTVGATTDDVVAGGIGDTSADPADLQIPGNAEVVTDGAGLFEGPGTADLERTLPVGTRLRVIDGPVEAADPDGVAMVEVVGIDDPSIGGFVATSDLVARDSTAPVIRGLDTGGRFSPNGDGQLDMTTISARFSETAAWSLSISDDTGSVFDKTGQGQTLDVTWKGLVAGEPVADGTYRIRVTAVDAWGNGPAEASQDVVVDTRPPTLSELSPAASTTQWFSPNGDGVRDRVTFRATNDEAGDIMVKVRDTSGGLVAKWSVANGADPVDLAWDGRTDAGTTSPDGVYTITASPQDGAGNTGPAVARTVQLIAALRSVVTSRRIFFPQDLDGLARTTDLSFVLQRPMTVDWAVLDSNGVPVATHLDAVHLAAGSQSWTFDGRDDAGTMLPRGVYTARAIATDGSLTATQAATFVLDAFDLHASDTSPARGQVVSLTIGSAEVLAKAPRLIVDQPGLSRWKALTTKVGKHTYTVTIRLRTGGGAGPMSLKVKGTDKYGRRQSTTVVYGLH